MSNAVSALMGAKSTGMVTVQDAGLMGMITLRGDLSSAWMASAVKDVMGLDLPAQRSVVRGALGAVVWMSYDELLVVTDYARAAEVVAGLTAAMGAEHGTAADVSDARAVFHVDGAQARDVLAKLCPVDFADFPVGRVRRTRAAQVAAAVWRDSERTFTLVCFRSVGRYVFDALTTVARPGGDVGLYK